MHPAPICAKIPIPVTGPAVDEYCDVASAIDGLYPYRVRKFRSFLERTDIHVFGVGNGELLCRLGKWLGDFPVIRERGRNGTIFWLILLPLYHGFEQTAAGHRRFIHLNWHLR